MEGRKSLFDDEEMPPVDEQFESKISVWKSYVNERREAGGTSVDSEIGGENLCTPSAKPVVRKFWESGKEDILAIEPKVFDKLLQGERERSRREDTRHPSLEVLENESALRPEMSNSSRLEMSNSSRLEMRNSSKVEMRNSSKVEEKGLVEMGDLPKRVKVTSVEDGEKSTEKSEITGAERSEIAGAGKSEIAGAEKSVTFAERSAIEKSAAEKSITEKSITEKPPIIIKKSPIFNEDSAIVVANVPASITLTMKSPSRIGKSSATHISTTVVPPISTTVARNSIAPFGEDKSLFSKSVSISEEVIHNLEAKIKVLTAQVESYRLAIASKEAVIRDLNCKMMLSSSSDQGMDYAHLETYVKQGLEVLERMREYRTGPGDSEEAQRLRVENMTLKNIIDVLALRIKQEK